ncbi:magnesium-translocating P-type ATPase [Lactobacillus helsingborgensis]|uniref:magnesium-translocating P-type ATPase n=1 Tax=Lactobacillus helsingborgensis TaxID=1218494 RepID=UPI00164F3F66|nr:magnesium-translocating P-type ATPase [Lactobacillus helsingborgensis]MBC6357254.1 magnesium-translocating P-type ATPase [Lactobacillus helsingborgensis]
MLRKPNGTAANKDLALVKAIAKESRSETLARLHASSNGLSSEQAEKNRAEYGSNTIATSKHNSKLRFLAEAFITPFTLVLLVLATLSLFTDYIFVPAGEKDLTTVAIMVTMVLISGITSFVQNVRSSNAVDSLLKMVSVTTDIIRDGKDQEIDTSKVVVGDVIRLAAGDMVPADMRLLTSKDLFCSSSSLNGESNPVEKIATRKPKLGSDRDYLDYPNILYEGTTIVSGSGLGIVFATGERTMFGKLAHDISHNDVKNTTFDIGIKNVSKLLIIMTAIIAPLVFIINGITKGDWINALIFSIATAVGLTPEMLPVIVTTNLVKGSIEMSKKGTIVKKMNSIQNFGSADILCTDKTGTLTQDKVVLERHYDLNLQENPRILELGYLNSYYQTGMKNLIDKAIIEAAGDELDINEIQRDYNKIDEIPFDFSRRRMSVVVENSDEQHGKHLLVTKGASEEMMAVATKLEVDGQILPLTPERKQRVMAKVNDMNDDGLRVIMLGYKRNPAPVGEFSVKDENDLILCGYLAFLDPPKESAKDALARLKYDGINVKILTGDNEAVTRTVGLQVGLNVDTVYSGADLEGKKPEELAKMVEECNIFVKLSPEDKTKIINLLKQNGHTVGYMGDGINDAPAMKAADVSISVDTAVDIAKESADIILLHKDLNVLEEGVRIGRKVFGNTMKYIKITLSSNFGNILSIMVASSFLPFLPMLPLQLLVLDLLYGTSCLALPFDDMSDRFLKEPRTWSTKKLPKFMFYFGPTSSVFDILTFALLFFVICPQLVGGNYNAISETQKVAFVALFHTGWFIESLWTQEMVIHALRDPRLPFIKQHAAPGVTLATFGAGVIGSLIPFSFLAQKLGFGKMPISFMWVVFAILVMYILLTTLVKHFYLKGERFLI